MVACAGFILRGVAPWTHPIWQTPLPTPSPSPRWLGSVSASALPSLSVPTPLWGGGDGLVYMIQRLNETKIVVAVCAGALRGLAVDKL